jgi:hypothetical protein
VEIKTHAFSLFCREETALIREAPQSIGMQLINTFEDNNLRNTVACKENPNYIWPQVDPHSRMRPRFFAGLPVSREKC